MKQTLLFLGTFFITALAFGQNLQLLTADGSQELESNISLTGDTENMMVLEFLVKNNDTKDITARLERVNADVVDGSVNSICVSGTCLMPNIDLSPEFDVPANDELSGFYVEYNPDGNPGVATIDYKLFNVDDTLDAVSFTVVYDASASVEDPVKGVIVSDLYPNPASSNARVDYNLSPGSTLDIEMYDMLGNRVFDYNREGTGTLSIPVNQLESGTYLYQYSIDGEIMDTQKLIIK